MATPAGQQNENSVSKFAEKLSWVKFWEVADAELYITRNDSVEGIVAIDVRRPTTDDGPGEQYTLFYYEQPDYPIENLMYFDFGRLNPVVPVIHISFPPDLPVEGYVDTSSLRPLRPFGWVRQRSRAPELQRIGYNYNVAAHPTRLGRVVVVAAPGVEIHLPQGDVEQCFTESELINHHTPLDYQPVKSWGFRLPELLPVCEVIRVWDGARVPQFGSQIDPQAFFQPTKVQIPGRSQYYVRSPLHSGETVNYFSSDDTFQCQLKIQVPIEEYSERYSLSFEHEPDRVNYGFFDRNTFKLFHSFNFGQRPQFVTTEGRTDKIGSYTEWYQKRYRSFTDVPLPGERTYVDREELESLSEAPPGSGYNWYGFFPFAVDLGIGFIPVAGDLVDFSEFAWMIYTGQDKWGNEVGPLEKVLMGVGCLLPFAGAAAFSKAGSKIISEGAEGAYEIWRKLRPSSLRRSPSTELGAIEALLAMDNGHLYLQAAAELDTSTVDMLTLVKHVEAIEDGSYYSQHWRKGALSQVAEAAMDMLQAFWKSYKKIQDASGPRALVNGSGDGFVDPVIQAEYRRGGGGDSPLEWLARHHNDSAVSARLSEIFDDFNPALFFPADADSFIAALKKSGAPPTAWGHEWPTSLGDDVVGIEWQPPLPINMPTSRVNSRGRTVLEHTDWDTLRKRAWQNYAFYHLLRQSGSSLDGGFDAAMIAVRDWAARNGDQMVSDIKLGREFSATDLLEILDSSSAPKLPDLHLSQHNLTRGQRLYVERNQIVLDKSVEPSAIPEVWSVLGVFELRKNAAIKAIFRRHAVPIDTASIKQASEMALGSRPMSGNVGLVAKELEALGASYAGGRSRLRYTTFKELMSSAASGTRIPHRSVLEIDHGIRQEAHSLTELLLGEGNATASARLTEVGNPFNLDPVNPGEHMLRDAHRLVFSSSDAFSRELKQAAREMEEQFLRPFANVPDNQFAEIVALLKSEMKDGRMPDRLRNVSQGKERDKVRRAIWHLNNEILLRGLPETLLPGLG